MKAYTYVEKGKFKLIDKPKPTLLEPTDAIVKVTLGSICTSDLHIKHGSVPRAVVGVTIGHEMVGIVEEVGKEVGRHVIREGMKTVAQGAGCMLTLLAMLTGVGALFALVIAICA